MSSIDLEEERFWKELEVLSKKYEGILSEINLKFRQKIRELGVRKNVVPTKYVLPKGYITKLLEDPSFRDVWKRKPHYVFELDYHKEDLDEKRRWVRVEVYPNIGGVPVEEGPDLQVFIERIPRRKRRKKVQCRKSV